MEIMEETQVEDRKYLEKYLEERHVELWTDRENTKKSKLNSEKIGKIWKKARLNSDKIGKILKQPK